MLSLLTANIGGLFLEEDLINLIKSIKNYDPDIVILQEVIKKDGVDILALLQDKLLYNFTHFAFKHDFSKDYGKGVLQNESVKEGLVILSKKSFKVETISLPIIQGKDRWPRIAVRYVFNNFSLCNIHLSKFEESRCLAVKELPIADVYAGDFNMQPDELENNFSFTNSFSFKKYVSFPSKKLTLDYVLLREGSFDYLVVIENISDHNGLFVKFSLLNK